MADKKGKEFDSLLNLLAVKRRAGSGLYSSRMVNVGRKIENVELSLEGDESTLDITYKLENALIATEEIPLFKRFPAETVELTSTFRAIHNTRLKLARVFMRNVEDLGIENDIPKTPFHLAMERLTPPPPIRWEWGEKWDWRESEARWKKIDAIREFIINVLLDSPDLRRFMLGVCIEVDPRKRAHLVEEILLRNLSYKFYGTHVETFLKQLVELLESGDGLSQGILFMAAGIDESQLIEFTQQENLCKWIHSQNQPGAGSEMNKMLSGISEQAQAFMKAEKARKDAEGSGSAYDFDGEEDDDENIKGRLYQPRPPHEISFRKTDANWGKAEIVESPLKPDPMLRKKIRKQRPTDAGTSIGRIERVLSDKLIFTDTRPVSRGSLLVDCSGSMGLSVADVLEILRNVPGATVGIYSGGRTRSSSVHGYITVIARTGKVSQTLEKDIANALSLGGNVVDGPGLEWLASQPLPRIWYSDGGATGIGDASSDEIRESIEEICHPAKIVRIGNKKNIVNGFKILRKELNLSHYAGEV